MILPLRPGEDRMIDREMIRVQDQLDTKPTPTCNGKSSTNSVRLKTNSPITDYDKILRIVPVAKRLCTFALSSSDVPVALGPSISSLGGNWRIIDPQAMLPDLAWYDLTS
jgi:hypothetical protein